MSVLGELLDRLQDVDKPFMVSEGKEYYLSSLGSDVDVDNVEPGDVVAVVGDFAPDIIPLLFLLIEKRAVLVPLTTSTRSMHEHYFEAAKVKWVIESGVIKERRTGQPHRLIQELRREKKPGLVLFSSGTTGLPKAILHDMERFLQRFSLPRPSLRTISFLLFDHVGGLNTLFHTLFNGGLIVVPQSRRVQHIVELIEMHRVELLPTTPTFLRMLMLYNGPYERQLEGLKLITYGTEKMDEFTLQSLARRLPWVDFRQTYGMSELGILRIRSESRTSLWMQIGGEGVELRVVDGKLEIRSRNRMIGYLNASSPFDADGWFPTGDRVETKGSWVKVLGRESASVNIAGQKVLPAEVEELAMTMHGVKFAKAFAGSNPITGEHLELLIEVIEGSELTETEVRSFLADSLPKFMIPSRIKFGRVEVSPRVKRQ